MRVEKFSLNLDGNDKPILVKEVGKNYPGLNLNTPESVKSFINSFTGANMKAEEYLWIIGLNTKNKILGVFEVSHGTVNSSLVSSREIFIRLCLCAACSFIVVHNHPGKSTNPSGDDIKTTETLKEAGKIMGIRLMDHIIVGGENYFSFQEEELI